MCITVARTQRWHLRVSRRWPPGLPLMHRDYGPTSVARRRNMKTLIATVALATALVAPIFTQAATAAPNDVIVGGKSIGQDPDATVRLPMRRDAGREAFAYCFPFKPKRPALASAAFPKARDDDENGSEAICGYGRTGMSGPPHGGSPHHHST